MTEAGFTKGSWEACRFGDYGDFNGKSRIILGDDKRIAVVQVQTKEHAEDNANARLIAAAPELYEAVKKLKDAGVYLSASLKNKKVADEAIAKFMAANEFARAALKKAEGGDQ